MLLCIDIGNTNITFGLFEGEDLGPCWRIRTIHDRMPDEYGILLDQLFRNRAQRPERVTGVVVASGDPASPPTTHRGPPRFESYPCSLAHIVTLSRESSSRFHSKQRASKICGTTWSSIPISTSSASTSVS